MSMLRHEGYLPISFRCKIEAIQAAKAILARDAISNIFFIIDNVKFKLLNLMKFNYFFTIALL